MKRCVDCNKECIDELLQKGGRCPSCNNKGGIKNEK